MEGLSGCAGVQAHFKKRAAVAVRTTRERRIDDRDSATELFAARQRTRGTLFTNPSQHPGQARWA
jgi:hypothetical protein